MEKIFEGKTEQDAVERAAKELGVSREYMDIEVVKKKKAGLFGMNNKVTIKVVVDGLPQDDDVPEYDREVTNFKRGKQSQTRQTQRREKLDEVANQEEEVILNDKEQNLVYESIKNLTELMQIVVTEITFVDKSPYVILDLENPEDENLLIGKHGKNIEALQVLVNAILRSKSESGIQIVLDIAGYREARTQWLQSMAIEKAERVLETGKSFVMSNFSPYDRKLIHRAVQTIDGVRTDSEGDRYLKRVRISLE